MATVDLFFILVLRSAVLLLVLKSRLFIIFYLFCRIQLITERMYQIADNHFSETMNLLTYSVSL